MILEHYFSVFLHLDVLRSSFLEILRESFSMQPISVSTFFERTAFEPRNTSKMPLSVIRPKQNEFKQERKDQHLLRKIAMWRNTAGNAYRL